VTPKQWTNRDHFSLKTIKPWTTCPQKREHWNVQFHITNCIINLHSHTHDARKVRCNNFHVTVQSHGCGYLFMTGHALPLSFVRFLRLANDSSKFQRSPARWSCYDRESSHEKSGAMSRSIPHNFPTIAGPWPMQCRRMTRQMVRKTTRKETCNSQWSILRNISQVCSSQPAVTLSSISFLKL
jgi:hypothetical protein